MACSKPAPAYLKDCVCPGDDRVHVVNRVRIEHTAVVINQCLVDFDVQIHLIVVTASCQPAALSNLDGRAAKVLLNVRKSLIDVLCAMGLIVEMVVVVVLKLSSAFAVDVLGIAAVPFWSNKLLCFSGFRLSRKERQCMRITST